jgi:RNA polymerase sigma factor (sigma-70 family)
MGGFRRLDETALAALDEAGLIEYVLAAREAGDRDAEGLGLQIFAFGMQDRILAFVRNKLGSKGDLVIEEVAERAIEDAIRSIEKLRGSTVGEARAFVFKIARLRIVDHHRRARIDTQPLEAQPGDEPYPGVADPRHDDEAAAVELAILVREALAELREDHRLVVELSIFRRCSAEETADQVNRRVGGQGNDPMSEQNVHQIVSRFRKDLRGRIEGTVRTG